MCYVHVSNDAYRAAGWESVYIVSRSTHYSEAPTIIKGKIGLGEHDRYCYLWERHKLLKSEEVDERGKSLFADHLHKERVNLDSELDGEYGKSKDKFTDLFQILSREFRERLHLLFNLFFWRKARWCKDITLPRLGTIAK